MLRFRVADLRSPVKPTGAVLALAARSARAEIIARGSAASRSTPCTSRDGSREAKHQRSQPSPSGPKATPGARPRPASVTRRLAKRERVAAALDARRTRRGRRAASATCDAGQRRQARQQRVAAGAQPPDQPGHEVVGLAQRGQAGALHEHRRARGVELDQLGERRRGSPAARRASRGASRSSGSSSRSCARRPEPVVRARRCRGSSARTRRAGAGEEDALVDLVGDDPGAGRAAVVEQRLLLGTGERPAGRVVRRVDEQHTGARRSRRGAARRGRAARRRRSGRKRQTASTRAPRIAGCAVRLGQTGTTATTSSPAPTSACIASISALTPDDVTAMRSAPTRRMQRADVARERLAQLGQAEVVRVEGLAVAERARPRPRG